MKRHLSLLIVVLISGLVALPAAAQCFGDDGFQPVPGTCCLPTGSNLPQFPQMLIPSEGCSFHNCGVEATWPVTIALSAPLPIFPDVYVSNITMFSAMTPTTTTFLVMKYARTWTEFSPISVRQVWRFLINTELTYTGLSTTPMPTPPCTSAYGQVHFTGSIDYAFDCLNGTWQALINLTHHCEALSHAPGSQRPLGGPAAHPDRAYAFVGPAPFVWGPSMTPGGPIIADSQRSVDANLNFFQWNTQAETSVQGGFLNPTNVHCLGTTASLNPLWTDYQMSFGYGCIAPTPYAFNPIAVPPILSTGLSSMSLGHYAHPFGTFAGQRHVRTWFGVATAPDPCLNMFSLPFHVVYGVSTQGGDIGQTFPDFTGVSVATDKFIDLHNSLIPNASAASGLVIGFGGIFLSTQIWSLNTP